MIASPPTATVYALLYCFVVSSVFVFALYILVPAHIRALPRDNAQHIQWRTAATAVVGFMTALTAPWLVSVLKDGTTTDNVVVFKNESMESFAMHTLTVVCAVCLHTAILYLGVLVQGIVEVVLLQQRQVSNLHQVSLLQALYHVHVESTILTLMGSNGRQRQWMVLRNLVWAPLMEEWVFRVHFVPVLLAADWKPMTVFWVAPLFFGVAHLHHAYQLRQQQRPLLLLQWILPSLLQFMYTTLFGAFAAYAYWKTRSVLAIVASHAFCNFLGLPTGLARCWQLSNTSTAATAAAPVSPGGLYTYRYWITALYVVGIVGFGLEFQYHLIFPTILNDDNDNDNTSEAEFWWWWSLLPT